jgi:hypothetical protein
MESPENLAELQEFILDMTRKYQSAMNKLNGVDLRNIHVQEIADLFSTVDESVLPEYPDLSNIAHTETRPLRTLESELARLWKYAEGIFKDFYKPNLPEFLVIIIKDRGNEGEALLDQLLDLIFRQIVVPELKKRENPGDDLFLLMNHSIMYSEEDYILKRASEDLLVPHTSKIAVYGLAGLLIQCERALGNGLKDVAYTYLMDAFGMVAMYNSTKFILSRFDKIANKRKGRLQGLAKHKKPNFANMVKGRTRELFFSLREIDPKTGLRDPWPGIAKAAEKIHEIIRDEVPKEVPPIEVPYTTIRDTCSKLYNQEKRDRSKPNYRFVVNSRLKDGTLLTIPID